MIFRRKRQKPSPDEITQAKQMLAKSHEEKEESYKELKHTNEVLQSLAQIRLENHIVLDIRKVLGGH